MRGRRERTMKEILEDMDLDRAILDRFNAERHPAVSVDGGSPWEYDLFNEEEE